jgi:hypothetical protein
MTEQEATIANSDLWCRYLRDQWNFLLDPLGLLPKSSTPDPIADGTAARIANVLTLVAFGPIAWLYRTNAAALDQPPPVSEP